MLIYSLFHFSSIFGEAFHGNARHFSLPNKLVPKYYHHNNILKRMKSNEETDFLPNDENTQEITLPIFPLRKSIKFPTDRITLSLFEERYLSLSDYILQQEAQSQSCDHPNSYGIFGALYCSGKAQMVKDGKSPITPMIEVGDIGTVFSVWSYNERDISNINDRRRVQLKAIGVDRFRVESILHNGYGGGDALIEDDTFNSSFAPTPFIIIKAKLINDILTDSSKLLDLEADVYDSITHDNCKREHLLENLYGKESYYNPNIMPNKLPFYYPSNATKSYFASNDSLPNNAETSLDSTYLAWNLFHKKHHSHRDKKSFQHELFSFAMASTLTSTRTSDEMIQLLSSTSTQERLDYIQKSSQNIFTRNPILNLVGRMLNR